MTWSEPEPGALLVTLESRAAIVGLGLGSSQHASLVDDAGMVAHVVHGGAVVPARGWDPAPVKTMLEFELPAGFDTASATFRTVQLDVLILGDWNLTLP